MARRDDQKRVERFMLDRFIDWADLDCAEVKEGVPPAPDYLLMLSDGHRIGVELTAASQHVPRKGAVQGTISDAIEERKRSRLAAYKATGIDEVWLVVHTTATIEGPDGLRRLEEEEVTPSEFDRVYLLDMVKGRASLRWPRP